MRKRGDSGIRKVPKTNATAGTASIQNAAGKFVAPGLPGIAAAAQTGKPLPDNSIPLVDPPPSAAAAYPISTFTYAIVPGSAPQGALLKQFITYAIGPGGISPAVKMLISINIRYKTSAGIRITNLPEGDPWA